MEWTQKHDILLCREILVVVPYKHKKGTNKRGKPWTVIAENLNAVPVDEAKFNVKQRGVRERFDLLKNKFSEKIKAEGTGTAPPEMHELEILLEEITETEKLAETNGNGKAKVERDRKAGEEVRKQAMEKLGESKERNEDDVSPNSAEKKEKKMPSFGCS